MSGDRASHPGEHDHATPRDQELPNQELDQLTLHGIGPRLERVAIRVPDLDRWIGLFEALLGPGFERAEVEQAHGPVEIAIHPAGVELVQSDVERPTLRSFHLATQDPTPMANIARGLGWET